MLEPTRQARGGAGAVRRSGSRGGNARTPTRARGWGGGPSGWRVGRAWDRV